MTNVMTLVFWISRLCLCIKHLSNTKFYKDYFFDNIGTVLNKKFE
ncbi:hypothetical protein AO372_0165 [Moraxella catarrhalis]|nr:hypothetical protein AO379_0136 [Moraxella catarrhalis]OAV16033.1 hypothetical protein AO376_0368 [Moraxella catarrhalis]OAV17029.1 hypothetical protein AO374_1564 [Moraxella catarrhalis]OAV19521.1 hypothetical protein AO373_0413 [Moraxella catarrhalis]OAV22613.1 hypothetical protein AO372_0165 [Moraxella catarrhalis]